MSEEVCAVWVVGTPLEGELACETLREHGIKCAVVELPSEATRTSAFRNVLAAGDTGLVLTVIVAPGDVERARQMLEDHTDLP